MLKLIGAPDRTIVGLIVQQALAHGLDRLPVRRLLIALHQGLLSAPGRAASPTMRWRSAAWSWSSA